MPCALADRPQDHVTATERPVFSRDLFANGRDVSACTTMARLGRVVHRRNRRPASGDHRRWSRLVSLVRCRGAGGAPRGAGPRVAHDSHTWDREHPRCVGLGFSGDILRSWPACARERNDGSARLRASGRIAVPRAESAESAWIHQNCGILVILVTPHFNLCHDRRRVGI